MESLTYGDFPEFALISSLQRGSSYNASPYINLPHFFNELRQGHAKKEIKQLILSVMTHLPWGHMITIENLHVQLDARCMDLFTPCSS